MAKEVEPLFGSMTDDPVFLKGLKRAISEKRALCLTERNGDERNELFLGGIVIVKEENEIAWFAVTEHRRGRKIGTALLSAAISHLDDSRPMKVTTFDSTIETGKPARHLYESFGFRDDAPVGQNPAGIPIVRMIKEANG